MIKWVEENAFKKWNNWKREDGNLLSIPETLIPKFMINYFP